MKSLRAVGSIVNALLSIALTAVIFSATVAYCSGDAVNSPQDDIKVAVRIADMIESDTNFQLCF